MCTSLILLVSSSKQGTSDYTLGRNSSAQVINGKAALLICQLNLMYFCFTSFCIQKSCNSSAVLFEFTTKKYPPTSEKPYVSPYIPASLQNSFYKLLALKHLCQMLQNLTQMNPKRFCGEYSKKLQNVIGNYIPAKEFSLTV